MKNKMTSLVCLMMFSLTSICETYITNVTIVDVEKQKLIPGQTVIISNGKFSGIYASGKAKISAAAMRIRLKILRI